MRRQAKWFGFLALALCAAVFGGLVQRVERELQRPPNLKHVAYASSGACVRCHRDHNASWYRTFHRTMTQAATDHSVRGDFGGASLRYFGAEARMERDPDGRFLVRYAGPDFAEQRYEVAMTVGSHRYQQYIGKKGDELVRLPVAFDLEQGRWFHMNGAFLTPDPEAMPASQGAFERHLTRWNDNCIFCHNVQPNPGKRGAHFDSQVAEFGIACEACHGPGSEHAQRNQNPVRRYRLHFDDTPDPSIVNPRRLSKALAADVCGRCHGQRITDQVDSFMRSGDPFVPGEDLALYSAPLWRDSELHGETGGFAARFWADGTPRLTAYEYQGLLLSPCYERGDLTCTTCHGMHEGDPRGQLRVARTGAAMCTDCHSALRDSPAQVEHAQHGDAPPDCVSCHMPRIVYGVLSTHISHRIEVPSPRSARTLGRPDACTLCHADRSREWAEEAFTRLFEPRSAHLARPRETSDAASLSEMEQLLFAGDPIERALAAHALGAWPRSLPTERPLALLVEALEHDPYPVVRRFAARALAQLLPKLSASLASFIPEQPQAERSAFVASLKQRLPVSRSPIPAAQLQALRERAADRAIEIGE